MAIEKNHLTKFVLFHGRDFAAGLGACWEATLSAMAHMFGEAQSSDMPWQAGRLRLNDFPPLCQSQDWATTFKSCSPCDSFIGAERGHGETQQCFRAGWVEPASSWASAEPVTGGCEQTQWDRATNTVCNVPEATRRT